MSLLLLFMFPLLAVVHVASVIVVACSIQWCESRPECNRLELKQLLVSPMQRLTRYSLLLSAIAKKTTEPEQKKNLDKIVSRI